MTHWMIEKSQGLTNVGLLRISESVRAYAYLVLSSQASARFRIIGSTASALTDIKRYQETLSYASSKVDYRMGENIYMLPSDMSLNISLRTVGYSKKIIISNGTFRLMKNSKVNILELVKSHKVVLKPTITHRNSAQEPTITLQKQTITHEEEKFP